MEGIDIVGKNIIYYFSFNSPWSYLGDMRLSNIAIRHNANITYKPTNFSLVFPKTGGLPLSKRAPARKAYRLQELERWQAHLDIPLIKEPKHWPSNERLGVGMLLAAINKRLNVALLSNAIFSALWAEDSNIGDECVLINIAEQIGFNGLDLLEAGRDEKIESQWIQNAKDALDLGVFGAPSYVVGEQLFWGQDRLEFLERALVGPQCNNSRPNNAD